MKMIKKSILIFMSNLLLVLISVGCSKDTINSPADGSDKYPVKFKATINHLNVTRADDSGFADGDKIGIYMVDLDGSDATVLRSHGNHADNQSFSYNEKSGNWESQESLCFRDASTPAVFYGYYPYIEGVSDVEAIPVSVQLNQSAEASSNALSGYEKSDLLWTKTIGVSPKTNIINLSFNHVLAGVEVNLIEGYGFDSGEWNSIDKSVMIEGTVREGLFNLTDGSIQTKASSDIKAIIANPTNNGFRAIVMPQDISAGTNLVTVNIGSDAYSFQKDDVMTYMSGKLHKLTFEVSKKMPEGDYQFELIGETVTVWENDQLSHDGVGRAYKIVELMKGQRLQEVLEASDIDPKAIINLKIKGFLNTDDFAYIRDNMRKIQALNLKETRIIGQWEGDDYIPDAALTNSITLKHIVLPDILVGIGDWAFAGTIIEGSLRIPEGVKHIGSHAFSNYCEDNVRYPNVPRGGQLLANNNLTGTLELPSTVEYIGEDAFRACSFSGQLILPESLKHLGRNAFNGCRNFSGEIHFPESLTEIEDSNEGVFYGITGIGGVMELPRNLKVINGFGGIDVSQILIPEGAVEIGRYAFYKSKVKGGIVIPKNVINIGEYAFSSCNATSITLPDGLTRINGHSFEKCINLIDTLVIPKNVEVIGDCAFRECINIQALVLPEKLKYISSEAFTYCYSLGYVRCNAVEPPIVDDYPFVGVNMDNFTVEVPEQSVEAYRNAPGWREFKRIAAYKDFVARPSKYNVLNKGGKKEIILNADADWEMIECPSWCHIDKTSGSMKTSLTLTVDEMSKGAPVRNGNVVFKLKGNNEYQTSINIGQYDYEYDEDHYIELQKASKGKGIDLFLLGDGYDAIDISSGLLMKDMKQTMEYFFDVEPYATYKDYFNVYTAITLSEDSGVEELNKWRNTKFHTVIPHTCDLRISADWKSAMDYCAEICPPLVSGPDPMVGLILLANYDGYDGVTYSIGDSFCSLVTRSSRSYPMDARGLVQHEAGGHGIGWLADEYIYHRSFIQKCECACCQHVAELIAEQSGGYGLNVSFNGKYKEVPWSHLIFNPSYGDIVDVYEGGYFHQRGVYRSEYNSCMNNNIPYFSTWSRQLIVQRIMKLAGEQFSLDSFYAKDKRDMGRDFTTSRSLDCSASGSIHGNPPVFIKDYKFGKKGGKR